MRISSNRTTNVRSATLAIAAIVLIVVGTWLFQIRKVRQDFEKCRAIHLDILAQINEMKTLRTEGRELEEDRVWHNACDSLELIFAMTWGHYPAPLSYDAYVGLSGDLREIFHAQSKRSEILEAAWTRIGQTDRRFHDHLLEKEKVFAEILERLESAEAQADGAHGDPEDKTMKVLSRRIIYMIGILIVGGQRGHSQ